MLADGDGKWQKPVEQEKTKFKEDVELQLVHPQLSKITTTCRKDFCKENQKYNCCLEKGSQRNSLVQGQRNGKNSSLCTKNVP